MIITTAKINLLSGDNKALTLGSTNLSKNNLSSDLSSVIGVKKQSTNPFILGVSKLGTNATYSNGVDYFISDQISNENGLFTTPIEIVVDSQKQLQSLTVAFDTKNNGYPYRIKVSSATPIKETQASAVTIKNEGVITQRVWDTTTNSYKYGVRIYVDGNNFSDFDGWEIARVNYVSAQIYDFDDNLIYLSNITYGKDQWGNLLVLGSFFDKPYRDINEVYSFDLSLEVSHYVVVNYEKTEISYYQDDDSIFTMVFPQDKEVYGVFLTIETWSKPNSPFVITGIYTEIALEINRRNIISLERTIYDRSDLKLPSFGIISNTGNIEFNDIDGEIKDYAEELLLESGLKCEIWLKNTLVEGAEQRIGLFETDQWDYDNDSRVVSVSLKDDLEEWQNINVSEISYNPQNPIHQPFAWLYKHLWELTKNNYNMLSFDELDENTKKVLNTTYTKYPLLKAGTLWEQWTKLCEVCQLHIYKNNDGIIVCRYNGGN